MNYHIESRSKTLWRLYTLPSFVLAMAAVAAVVQFSALAALLLASAVFFVYIIILFWYIPKRSGAILFSIDRNHIKIQKGIINKKYRIMPKSNIQYIFVTRNPVEKMLGLCTVKFMLGAGKISLSGVTPKTAERFSIGI